MPAAAGDHRYVGTTYKAVVLEVHSLKGTDEAALGCSRNMYTQPYITPLRTHW